jgi:hypothetical protein
MVVAGAFTRLGTDELVPPSKVTKSNDLVVRTAGLVTFLLSSVCLFFILYNLLYGIDPDPSNGWVAAFSLPWIGYGIVSMVAILWRQIQPAGYPEALSVFKDVAFGALDIWCVLLALHARARVIVLTAFSAVAFSQVQSVIRLLLRDERARSTGAPVRVLMRQSWLR